MPDTITKTSFRAPSKDRASHLRVKIKALAAESRIIRNEEQRVKRRRRGYLDKQGYEPVTTRLTGEFDSLHRHRVWDVRRESRASLLAYGFILGKRYSKMENPKSHPDGGTLARIKAMACKYGNIESQTADKQIKEWLTT